MPTSFTQWLGALKKYWSLSLLSFLGVMAFTTAIILFVPREYQSQAKVMLRVGREAISADPTVGNSTLDMHRTRETEIQSSLGVMKSRQILEKVVDEVGEKVVLEGKPEIETKGDGPGMLGSLLKLFSVDPISDREVAVRDLAEDVSIYAPADSSVVSVTYQTDSPQIAQVVLDAWIDSYITEHARVNRTQGTFEFFTNQGMKLEAQLEKARRDLQEAKSKYELVTIPGAQLMLETQMTAVRQSLLEVEAEMAAAKSRVKAYEELLANSIDETITEETDVSNEARDAMRNQLFTLEVQEKDLRSKFTKDHPKLLAVQRQLAEAQEIVSSLEDDRKQVTRSVNPAHQQLSQERMIDLATEKGMADKREKLELKKAELLEEMAALNGHERMVAKLTRDVEIFESRYVLHAEQLEQARMDQVLEEEKITSVSIVQPASFEERPVTPNKPVCAVIGFIAACAFALSLPILMEIRSISQAVQRRSAPVADEHDWFHEPDHAERPRGVMETPSPVSD